MHAHIRHLLTRLGVLTARPWAFGIVGLYGLAWIYVDAASFDWHGVAVLATWLMTLVIQRAEHRDTQAVHAKLDELLHADNKARNALTRVDEDEPETIEKQRARMRVAD
jgi:low affinity Fe/Cu permease